MDTTGRGRVSGRGLAIALAAVLVVGSAALGAVAAWRAGALNSWICEGQCDVRYVTAPTDLSIAPTVSAPTPRPLDQATLVSQQVRRAVDRSLQDPSLGPRVGLAVAAMSEASDTSTPSVARLGARGALAPASTTKVLTAFAALSAWGSEHRFATATVLDGDRVVLVGGGDPYLVIERTKGMAPVKRAELTVLARRTADALRAAGRTTVRLGYDTSLFEGSGEAESWEPSYVPEGTVEPISALWTAGSRYEGAREARPADRTAAAFARLLAAEGISVDGETVQATAPTRAVALATVESATLAQIVQEVLLISDNEAAEVLAHQAAIATGLPATFAGGATATTRALEAAGIDTSSLRLLDGSGLSRGNRIDPSTLVQVLVRAQREPATADLLAGLPVGGFSGSLASRFTEPADTRGAVRAKTGTLTGVHSLAGVVLDASGSPMAFAVMVDDTREINPFLTRAALETIASDLAACSCTRR